MLPDHRCQSVETDFLEPQNDESERASSRTGQPKTEIDGRIPCLASLTAWLRQYFERRVDLRLADERRSVPPHVFIDLGNQGLLGIVAPREEGGLGLPISTGMRLIEYMGTIDQSVAAALIIHNFLAGSVLRSHGTRAVKERYARDVATGRCLLSFALTEPEAGSDPRQMGMTATRHPRGWQLNGTKIWIGLGAWSSAIVTFAKIACESHDASGFLALLVPQETPGVVQQDECLTMGLRGIIQNKMTFTNALVDDAFVLGPTGEGLGIAKESMLLCRVAIGALSLGGMRRARQYLTTYARKRKIATGRMLTNPVVANTLTLHTLRMTAAATFLDSVYAALDRGQEIREELCLACKIVLPELMWKSVDETMQMLGGRGYSESNGFARLFRDTRVCRIFEGATETLASHLGGLVAADSKAFLELLYRFRAERPLMQEMERIVARVEHARAARPRLRDDYLWMRYQLGKAGATALFAAVVGSLLVGVDPIHEQLRAWILGLFQRESEDFLHLRPFPLLRVPDDGDLPPLALSESGEDVRLDPLLK
jgi:alkylation response protein AidB-like acyl-CoA dehydrogenase